MKLTTATISSNPREVATKFGQRTVIDAIRTDTNESIAIWRPPNDRYVQKLGKMAKLYGFCLQQADSLGAIDKDRQAIATALFLSAQKKFNL